MTSWQNYIDFMKSRNNAVEEVMIVSSEDGAQWGNFPDSFILREYPAQIMSEDGTESEQIVNEAVNLMQFIKGPSPPAQGLRLNGGKKQQIIRNFKDEVTGGTIIYGKYPQGGSCVADAGRCILVGTFSEAKNQTSQACNDLITLMSRYLKDSTWPDGAEGSAAAQAAAGGVNKTTGEIVSAESSSSKTWQPFVDTMLIAKGNVTEALICAKSDGKMWASSNAETFSLKTYEAEVTQEDGSDKLTLIEEAKNLTSLMNSSPGTRPGALGLRINGVKYQFLKGFEEENAGCYTVYGKKTRGGCCIVTTKRAIIVAVFDEGQNHTGTGCNASMSDLAKHLNSLGY